MNHCGSDDASGQVYANYRWPNCESRLVEFGQVELDYRFTLAGVAELADAIDSKSIVRKGVMVRVHSPVFKCELYIKPTKADDVLVGFFTLRIFVSKKISW